jgi:hypothetical protein
MSYADVRTRTRVETHFTFIEQGAMLGCDAPCAGFVLLPATRDLRDDLRSTPADAGRASSSPAAATATTRSRSVPGGACLRQASRSGF